MANKNKPRCTSGQPCGFSCISLKKSCSSTVDKEAAKALLKVVKAKKSSKVVSLNGKKVAVNYDEIDRRVSRLKELYDIQQELVDKAKAKGGLDSLTRDEKINLKKALEDFNSGITEVTGAMDKVREALLKTGATRAKATKFVNSLSITEVPKRDLVKEKAVEFYMLVNGALNTRINGILPSTKTRSSARSDMGLVYIATDVSERVVYHELAHIVEDEEARRTNNRFIRERGGNDGKLYRLSQLTGDKRYPPREIAVRDKFPSHYTGKYYGTVPQFRDMSDGWDLVPTEVLSKGLENFTNGKAMADLYMNDPEHFKLAMDFLNKKRQ